MYRFKIFVILKKGVLDPQGQAVKKSLHALGYQEVQEVKVGKYMEVDLEAESVDVARERVKHMCDKLLANPVIEEYRIEQAEFEPVEG
ncbi:phosphoribosylformylglycinamidine synthase subunit PurS [Caldalkalibacillus thermarum]|uniref:phosphoribosylformylglycinamidine synthase subunit PurS n=1 Tax=Caldalkalibacillus thermarum TaxID=296745 RepID=UPI00166DDA2D|nr:phosphoribosylformylglycinamidine synthase subunit PurS [Caldalkalibacillus thermarum]GGK33990.1 phosphoribosylformylglycinamidine synthase subunit PurS [Caldalkalibacillus thermarum]